MEKMKVAPQKLKNFFCFIENLLEPAENLMSR